MSYSLATVASPVGDLSLVASPLGLAMVAYSQESLRIFPELSTAPGNPILAQAKRELEAYFAGALEDFSVPLDRSMGGAFRLKVHHAISSIPFGLTISYGQLAKLVDTRGVQAVGSACGANPLPIIVPCHRVLKGDGSLVATPEAWIGRGLSSAWRATPSENNMSVISVVVAISSHGSPLVMRISPRAAASIFGSNWDSETNRLKEVRDYRVEPLAELLATTIQATS